MAASLYGFSLTEEAIPKALARISHQVTPAKAHLRALAPEDRTDFAADQSEHTREITAKND